jgi:hypothetical protein
MNNVHRLVVPTRDETRSLPAQAIRRMGEVLILPCVRYERIDAQDGQNTRRGPATSHEPIRQDLTA